MRGRLFITVSMCLCMLTGCTKTNKLNEEHTEAPEDLFLNADIDGQTVYDSQNIVIKAVSLSMNSPGGPSLRFSGENKTYNDRVVTIKNCSVNNIMIEPAFEMKINTQSEAEADAVFPGRLLLTADIKTFSGISFYLRIADASDSKNYVESDQYNMFTSMTGKYTQKFDFPGALIADDKGVSIKIGRIADPEAPLGKQIYIYTDNSTSSDIIVEAKDTKVNGIDMDPLFFTTVGAGKKSWAPLIFHDSDIVKNGVVSIDDLIISLRAISIYGVVIDTGACRVVFEQSKDIGPGGADSPARYLLFSAFSKFGCEII